MSDNESDRTAGLGPELRSMKLEEGASPRGEGAGAAAQVKEEDVGSTPTPVLMPARVKSRSKSQSPVKQLPSGPSTPDADAHEEVLGGEITLKMEPGKAPKLSRTASQKILSRPPLLYRHLPDVTQEAKATFDVLLECTYANKHLGTTEHALECDCSEEWDSKERINNACGDDSDCINRATKMECVGDCGCGRQCQNQRFQQKQYANVTVIKTEKKGFGLRANTDMKPGDFVFEYIGEVIEEKAFRRRMVQYDQEGIKHFYFMSLTKGEFVDATKKGNLGRFCNHSCNPNCFVDKWVVGDKLRMGIFVERKIKAGEELVFNYNVDRYGADPQPCYCGEPNCTGFIGGRTQTDNATKLSHATIEALGIDDGDGWETAVAKRPRKKKASEDDEEYVNDIQPKSLEAHGVTKVMAALRQCTEKWIAVKLLDRIQQSNGDKEVGHRVIRMHGYEILKTTLVTWKDDPNVVLQILDVLHELPRLTRNKIQDSKIEEVVQNLRDECDDERVIESINELLKEWSKLELGYRIPRMKRDPNASTPARTDTHFERREKRRERSKSRSQSPDPKIPTSAPLAPRGFNAPKGPSAMANLPRPPPRPLRPFNSLPPGWFQAKSENGATYFYTASGVTQWTRPTLSANQPPPAPSKTKSETQVLQDIILSITASATPGQKGSASSTPQPGADEPKEKKSNSEKWLNMPQEKREKIYEGNISKHVMTVTSRYRKTFEKDDIKRLSKEVSYEMQSLNQLLTVHQVAKKLVRGDFKSNRVKDPTAPIGSKHEKTVKIFVKDFMDKAVRKKTERDKAKAARADTQTNGDVALSVEAKTPETPRFELEMENDVKEATLDPYDGSPTESGTDLKRKREEDGEPASPKKSRTEAQPSPPPPPPPPAEEMHIDVEGSTLTPMDDDPVSIHSTSDGSVNGVKPKTLNLASPMQLATPPTKEHSDYANGGNKNHKRLVIAESRS
ncbi:histone methyltransferase set2 [Kalmusia sp. IMI 367209]|nr:histone methyltransferase set2 [Kalmusia sp. IMI 367209]